ncbi:hypothetical protein [Luteitalea pratensis]|nr:hypothetical protein [Luteitalea pratensis]
MLEAGRSNVVAHATPALRSWSVPHGATDPAVISTVTHRSHFSAT